MTVPGTRSSQRRSIAALSLLAANLILLGVTWVVSVKTYGRLPGQILPWSSVWTGRVVPVDRSLAFFIYPLFQVLFSAAFLILAERLFVRARQARPDGPSGDPGAAGRLTGLRREVAYLALIFFNLVFIHLQTSLILLTREVAPGINKPYFLTLFVMILFILGPYYRIRRKILLTEKSGPPRPR